MELDTEPAQRPAGAIGRTWQGLLAWSDDNRSVVIYLTIGLLIGLLMVGAFAFHPEQPATEQFRARVLFALLLPITVLELVVAGAALLRWVDASVSEAALFRWMCGLGGVCLAICLVVAIAIIAPDRKPRASGRQMPAAVGTNEHGDPITVRACARCGDLVPMAGDVRHCKPCYQIEFRKTLERGGIELRE